MLGHSKEGSLKNFELQKIKFIHAFTITLDIMAENWHQMIHQWIEELSLEPSKMTVALFSDNVMAVFSTMGQKKI